jgi:hypothetical protein
VPGSVHSRAAVRDAALERDASVFIAFVLALGWSVCGLRGEGGGESHALAIGLVRVRYVEGVYCAQNVREVECDSG